MTKKLYAIVCRMQIWKETKGQDLIEYALMAGFVAVAAGAVMPGISTQVATIFSKVSTQLSAAAAQGTGS